MRQVTRVDHGTMLAHIKDRIFEIVGAGPLAKKHAAVLPVKESLPPEKFAIFVEKFMEVSAKHGHWPVEIDGQRYCCTNDVRCFNFQRRS